MLEPESAMGAFTYIGRSTTMGLTESIAPEASTAVTRRPKSVGEGSRGVLVESRDRHAGVRGEVTSVRLDRRAVDEVVESSPRGGVVGVLHGDELEEPRTQRALGEEPTRVRLCAPEHVVRAVD